MASSNNGNGNLVDEFEESFQACIHALTKQEASTGVDRDEIALEVEQTTTKFIDLARQMEAFFLQKRFLLSALKPELVLKEENVDLRYEITRKDDLIKKHYDRIEHWKNLLSDQQHQHPSPQQPPQQQQGPGPSGAPGPSGEMRPIGMGGMPGHGMPPNPGGPMPMPGMPNTMQAQLHMQQQQQQQQQQHLMQAQQLQHMQMQSFRKMDKR